LFNNVQEAPKLLHLYSSHLVNELHFSQSAPPSGGVQELHVNSYVIVLLPVPNKDKKVISKPIAIRPIVAMLAIVAAVPNPVAPAAVAESPPPKV